jgi:hypothetical protein
MNQALYAHMTNKRKMKKKKNQWSLSSLEINFKISLFYSILTAEKSCKA